MLGRPPKITEAQAKAALAEHGTQSDAAKALGVSRHTLLYWADPEFREQQRQRSYLRGQTPERRDQVNARRRERRATDPVYREQLNARMRERIGAHPEYRERENTKKRERRVADPEFRDRERKAALDYYYDPKNADVVRRNQQLRTITRRQRSIDAKQKANPSDHSAYFPSFKPPTNEED